MNCTAYPENIDPLCKIHPIEYQKKGSNFSRYPVLWLYISETILKKKNVSMIVDVYKGDNCTEFSFCIIFPLSTNDRIAIFFLIYLITCGLPERRTAFC